MQIFVGILLVGGIKRHSTLCKKYAKMTATVILYIGFSLYKCLEKTIQTVWKTWKTQGISFWQICKHPVIVTCVYFRRLCYAWFWVAGPVFVLSLCHLYTPVAALLTDANSYLCLFQTSVMRLVLIRWSFVLRLWILSSWTGVQRAPLDRYVLSDVVCCILCEKVHFICWYHSISVLKLQAWSPHVHLFIT